MYHLTLPYVVETRNTVVGIIAVPGRKCPEPSLTFVRMSADYSIPS